MAAATPCAHEYAGPIGARRAVTAAIIPFSQRAHHSQCAYQRSIYLNSRKRMRPHHERCKCDRTTTRNWHERKTAMTTPTEEEFDLLYGSKYLGVADLNGQRPRRTIGKVEVAELREKDGSTEPKICSLL